MGANGHLSGGTGDSGDLHLLHRSHTKIHQNPNFPQQILNSPAFPNKSTHSPQQKGRSEARNQREEAGWVRVGARRFSRNGKSSNSPAAIFNYQTKAEICQDSSPVAPNSKSASSNLASRLQCRSCADRERQEQQLAAAPAASQEAPPTTNSLAGVPPTPTNIPGHTCLVAPHTTSSDVGLVAGPVDPTKRSWADVVRSSAKVSPGSIEERCKGTCFKRMPALQKDDAHQWQQQIGDSEHSKAFKRWARGRCYRCLAHDHQVRSCKSPFRCIRCRGPGHRERHCRFRSPPTLSYNQKQTSRSPSKYGSSAEFTAMQHSTPFSEVTSEAPSHGHQSDASILRSASGRVASPTVSTSLDTKGLVSTLTKSLRAELVHMFEAQLEVVLRPIREEMSTIKLWLARVATHFENQKQEQDKEQLPSLNIGEFFGPYSPIRLSSTSTLLEPLTTKRTKDYPLGCEGSCIDIENSSKVHMPVEQPLQKEQTPIEAVGQAKNSVLVEESSDDEASPKVCMTLEDQVDIDTKVEEPHIDVDQWMNVSSSSDITKTVRHKRKSSGKPSSRRSSHNSQHNILKSLGVVKKNGNLDEDKLEEIADLLKELLPPSLLQSLMQLKGRLFWDTLSKILAYLLN